jgi:hypothetical protein
MQDTQVSDRVLIACEQVMDDELLRMLESPSNEAAIGTINGLAYGFLKAAARVTAKAISRSNRSLDAVEVEARLSDAYAEIHDGIIEGLQ